jgi:hypothetical protein
VSGHVIKHTDYMADERPTGAKPVELPSSSRDDDSRHSREEILPSTTSDERELGWGDEPSERSDDWFLSERPPHH